MSVLWRISNHSDLSGEGGRRGSARWHTRGRPIVYLADSPASAMLEQIVHLQDGNGKLPSFYHLLEIRAPEDLPIKDLLTMADAGWKQKLELTQRIGNAWLASVATPLARVPSAIVPRTWNYLLNPEHPDAGHVKIESAIRERTIGCSGSDLAEGAGFAAASLPWRVFRRRAFMLSSIQTLESGLREEELHPPCWRPLRKQT